MTHWYRSARTEGACYCRRCGWLLSPSTARDSRRRLPKFNRDTLPDDGAIIHRLPHTAGGGGGVLDPSQRQERACMPHASLRRGPWNAMTLMTLRTASARSENVDSKKNCFPLTVDTQPAPSSQQTLMSAAATDVATRTGGGMMPSLPPWLRRTCAQQRRCRCGSGTDAIRGGGGTAGRRPTSAVHGTDAIRQAGTQARRQAGRLHTAVYSLSTLVSCFEKKEKKKRNANPLARGFFIFFSLFGQGGFFFLSFFLFHLVGEGAHSRDDYDHRKQLEKKIK